MDGGGDTPNSRSWAHLDAARATGLNLRSRPGHRAFDAAVEDADGALRRPRMRSYHLRQARLDCRNSTVLGPTAFYGEYGRFKDYVSAGIDADRRRFAVVHRAANVCAAAGDACRVTGNEAEVWGLGVVQHIEEAEMQIYLGWRRHSADFDLVDVMAAAVAGRHVEDFDTLISWLQDCILNAIRSRLRMFGLPLNLRGSPFAFDQRPLELCRVIGWAWRIASQDHCCLLLALRRFVPGFQLRFCRSVRGRKTGALAKVEPAKIAPGGARPRARSHRQSRRLLAILGTASALRANRNSASAIRSSADCGCPRHRRRTVVRRARAPLQRARLPELPLEGRPRASARRQLARGRCGLDAAALVDPARDR